MTLTQGYASPSLWKYVLCETKHRPNTSKNCSTTSSWQSKQAEHREEKGMKGISRHVTCKTLEPLGSPRDACHFYRRLGAPRDQPSNQVWHTVSKWNISRSDSFKSKRFTNIQIYLTTSEILERKSRRHSLCDIFDLIKKEQITQ